MQSHYWSRVPVYYSYHRALPQTRPTITTRLNQKNISSFEGSFLFLSFPRPRTVFSATPGIFKELWVEYAKADRRWGTSDPTVVSLEILTVLGVIYLSLSSLFPKTLAKEDNSGWTPLFVYRLDDDEGWSSEALLDVSEKLLRYHVSSTKNSTLTVITVTVLSFRESCRL